MNALAPLLLLAACGPAFAGDAGTAARPNVVLIYVDDLGYGELGCYGCPDIPTPHVDRLAAEGVRFTASYITNPPCCPSRCSLMIGQYAQRFGKYGMSRGLPIPKDQPTLARRLADHGYATGQIGKWDLGSKRQNSLDVGFAEVARTPPKKRYSEAEIAAMPVPLRRKIESQGGRSKYFCLDADGRERWLTDYDGDLMVEFVDRHADEPFFLYWSPDAVHSFTDETPERLRDRTTATGKRRALAGSIVSVDDQVGKLLAALDRRGLRENTLVIFSSDNGANPAEGGRSAPYAGGKGAGTQKEGWVRVPTVLSLPGVIPEGATHDGLIANFDLYSTVSQLTTGEIPPHCDGVDLIAQVRGERPGPAHKHLFWRNDQPDDAPRRHLLAVRWEDWRLYRQRAADPWQLFDLSADPREETDLAAERPDLVTRLAERHAAWSATLAPLATVPNLPGPSTAVGPGHGWATAADSGPAGRRPAGR
ncbi:sulfatase family protein [Alienimonas chondri]|uniref:Arylsulfatase n=1 Tax=Alienimonas chondri TaxID=2681879 RepID=A0ABX1VCE6_9PLAN|nr:sulfatase-like hydrolase/transferase [Alienimonas chondri]NNJ24721.1 Arylsulfatase [Alienimonas chondri]